jgi:predicted  nucleic acid-binding Zn-ribbon protein
MSLAGIITAAFAFLLLIPAGCLVRSRTNSMSLTMLEIEVQQAQSTRDRLNRELWRLNEEIKTLRQRAEDARTTLANVDKDYQAKTSLLATKQHQLLAMEEDLAAIRQREAVVKKALAEVTALEQKAAQKEKLLAELKAKDAALDKQVKDAQAALAPKEETAKKLLQTLKERMATLDKLVPQLQAAVEAAKVLEPPKKEPPKQEPPKKD